MMSLELPAAICSVFHGFIAVAPSKLLLRENVAGMKS
jgi:hypothetical protein